MSLSLQILNAFSDLKRPNATAIAACRQGYISLEALRVQEFFSSLTWQQASLSALSKYSGDRGACLSFMTYDAFCYFFPSYLLMCIEDTTDENELLSPTVQFARRSEKNCDRFDYLLNKYSTTQKKIIGDFLILAADRNNLFYVGPEAACKYPLSIYDRYWHKFKNSDS